MSAGSGVAAIAHDAAAALVADGQSLAFVEVTLLSDDGEVLLASDRPVTAVVTGAGVLQGFGSANPITAEDYVSATHSTYYGRALAVVRAGRTPGPITVELSAEGCAPVTLTLEVR